MAKYYVLGRRYLATGTEDFDKNDLFKYGKDIDRRERVPFGPFLDEEGAIFALFEEYHRIKDWQKIGIVAIDDVKIKYNEVLPTSSIVVAQIKNGGKFVIFIHTVRE